MKRRWDAQSSEDRINECLERIETNTKILNNPETRTDSNNVSYAMSQIKYYLNVIEEVYKAKYKRKS